MNPNQRPALVNTLIARRPIWFNNLTPATKLVSVLANGALGLHSGQKRREKKLTPTFTGADLKEDTEITPHKIAKKANYQQAST